MLPRAGRFLPAQVEETKSRKSVGESDCVLAWLLCPFNPGQFLRRHWERKPLLIQRRQPRYYADLLTLRDLDSLLESSHRRLPGVRLVKAGTDIGVHRYSPEYVQVGEKLYGSINIDRVFAEHQAGATIILDSVHRSWPPLARFCRKLEVVLTQPVQANLYLTPQSAQGFEAHYDTHDVFILQVAGRKKWRIFPPKIRLPLRTQPHTGDLDASSPVYEFELAEGDSVYIPRGYVHEATTQRGTLSAHLTVGVIAYSWYDLFHQILNDICETELGFRESLPPGFTNHGLSAVLTKQKIIKLTRALGKATTWQKSLDSLSNQFVSDREPILAGYVSEQLRIGKIDLKTLVAIRDDIIYRIDVDDTTISLTFHGKSVYLPRYVGPAVLFIVENSVFQVGAIPDCIDKAGKLVLVRRLVKEGFLTTEVD